MTSLPKHAKLDSIIKDLFQNEVVTSDALKEYFTFSDLILTDDQQKQLLYPTGFVPMNIFVLQQVDSKIGTNSSNRMSMVSFVKKNDGYIYGYYFDITNQPRIKKSELTNSKHPIKLKNTVQFVPVSLLEIYNFIFGTTVILSLGFNSNNPYATLQYSQCDKYYYESLNQNGIINPQYPITKILELSKNLHKYTKDSC